MTVVVRLLTLADNTRGRSSGRWLVEYDPTRPDPRSELGVHLVAGGRDRAREFTDQVEAFRYINRPSGRVRRDGLPDKPIWAYHLMVDTAEGTV